MYPSVSMCIDIHIHIPYDVPVVDIDDIWRQALDLAWLSYREGTVPVGAVITDGGGGVVSAGRNRIHLTTTDTRHAIAGSRLAHAEMNAILGLPLHATSLFVDHTIYTTTEPCLLCSGAITMTKIGRVLYAAADPVAGSAATMVGGNPYLDHRRTVVLGPTADATAAFARLLFEEWSWRFHEHGLVERLTREREPQVAAIVVHVLADGLLRKMADDGGGLDDAMGVVAAEVELLAGILGERSDLDR